MSVTIKEIVQAYRLAKIDAWHFHSIDLDEFVQFEENFDDKVAAFAKLINTPADEIEFESEWLGGWRLQPKGVKHKQSQKKPDAIGDEFDDLALSSEPMKNFSPTKTEEVSFRLMATPSPEFHLLSSLWLTKVGYKFDKKLPSQSYGNRMRYSIPDNPFINGHFRYFVPDFKKWRTNALDAVVKCLKKLKREAVVVTADAKSFFHALSPDFLLNEEYWKKVGISLTPEQRRLTEIMIKAINTWALNTPLKTGLPVGLPVSSVIANAAFLELDLKLAAKGNGILSYGRYVDDILIVIDDVRGIRRKHDAWERLKVIAESLLELQYEGRAVKCASYHPIYVDSLTQSRIVFEGEKCKVFSLARKTGLRFVDVLKKQIAAVSSEFRLLPQNVGENDALRSKIQSLVTISGEVADNFRKIDSLRLRKSDFSGLLIEMEFYAQALQIEEWQKPRREFFALCNQYVMSLPLFFDFADKLPRIISLATMCGNFMQISEILESLRKILQRVSKVQNCKIASPSGYRDQKMADEVAKGIQLRKKGLKEYWIKPLQKELSMVIMSSFGVFEDQKSNELYKTSYKKRRQTISSRLRKPLPELDAIQKQVRLYLLHDLAHTRFIDHIYQKHVRPNSTHSLMGPYDIIGQFGYDLEVQGSDLFNDRLVKSALVLARLCERGIHGEKWVPYALLFPTRPVKSDDLFWIESSNSAIKAGNDLVFPYRGYYPNLPVFSDSPDKDTPSLLLKNTTLSNPRIALVSLRTEEYEALTSFRRSTKYRPLKRLNSILKIVNSILGEENGVQYVLFHELSIPHKWFLPIARRCAASGVSVIAGVDYIKGDLNKCRNQVWMSLVMRNEDGFSPSYFHVEDKMVLAYEEQSQLKKLKIGQDDFPKRNHGIIKHGNFAFSTLICSEITDIQNRDRLRGLIDALFILAWNQDHASFSPIIESSALDLHAYIVQCNNNKYGDSRVRVPGKEPWNRDIVRIRGGDDPYYVIVKLNVDELRLFQSSFVAPEKKDKFKPLPQGFRDAMATYRKMK